MTSEWFKGRGALTFCSVSVFVLKVVKLKDLYSENYGETTAQAQTWCQAPWMSPAAAGPECSQQPPSDQTAPTTPRSECQGDRLQLIDTSPKSSKFRPEMIVSCDGKFPVSPPS